VAPRQRHLVPCLLIATLSCLGAGCDDEPEPSSEDPAAAPEPPLSAGCRETAERVGAAFRRPATASLFRGEDPAPSSERGAELEPNLPQIVLGPDTVSIGGIEVRAENTPEVLAAEMEMRRALFASTNPDQEWPNAALLYVPNRTPLARLRDTLSALPEDLRYALVVQHSSGGAPEAPRPPPWLERELSQIRDEPSMSARRERFRQLFVRAAGDCADARAHGPFLFGPNPSAPAEAAPDGTLSEALEECRCEGVDVEAMVAIGILTGPPNRFELRGLSFRRATEAREEAIRAEGTRRVEWLVEQLEQADGVPDVFIAP
jgi:hypothetical protein